MTITDCNGLGINLLFYFTDLEVLLTCRDSASSQIACCTAKMIVTKKTAEALGMSIFDGVGSKVSVFARRQMEKMGWEEGKGLGKNETGIVKHIKAVKRDDNSGLGLEEVKAAELTDNWWHDGFSKNLKAYSSSTGGKKKKLSKKRRNKDDDVDGTNAPPSYAELFAATGGARLGMRARASQKGKILRTEGLSLTELVEISNDEIESIVVKADSSAKRKKTKVLDTVTSDETDIPGDVEELVSAEDIKESKQGRKKKKTIDAADESEKINCVVETVELAAEKEKKPKKKNKNA